MYEGIRVQLSNQIMTRLVDILCTLTRAQGTVPVCLEVATVTLASDSFGIMLM